jgi:hypothetical protein
MSKYDAIGALLNSSLNKKLLFSEIDAVVGGLPASAQKHLAWWFGTADASPTHVQKRAWEEAGYTVDSVNIQNKTVWFKKV